MKRGKMPEFIAPMLATLIEKPFDDGGWGFEIKWDGFRGLAFIDKTVTIKSRSNQVLNNRFPAIVKALGKVKGQAVLDGELVVLDKQGKSHFQLMQNYPKEGKGVLCYYVFDLLYRDGKDLRNLPLAERKEQLKRLLKQLGDPLVRYSDHVVGKGEAFFKKAKTAGLEGIIGKKLASVYQSRRSRDWVKIKTSLRQEVVIGGYTAPRGSRKKLGALLVGVYDEKKKLRYAGHVGGGFDASLLQEVYDRLQPLVQKTCPFEEVPKANSPVTWVKPKLLCEVAFAEWTKDNRMRQPIFQGLRSDKEAKEVKKEIPQKGKLVLTHLDKVFWPEEGYTKGDLLHYYESVSTYILPYLKDRPIVLYRFPNGIDHPGFYQKDLSSSSPSWLKTISIHQEGREIHYLLIDSLDSLLYAVNLGSIDLHPFMSRCENLDNPTYCVIDLDPRGLPFEKAVEVALTTHAVLEEAGIKHFCKTSGGKGLHILIPLHGKYDDKQSRLFAEVIAHHVHERLPTLTSMERSPKKRNKQVYLDCLQNRFGQTIVAPYAVRPRPHAPVSTPLLWEEVTPKLDPLAFNIKTTLKRLKTMGDLFKPVLQSGINLKSALKKFE